MERIKNLISKIEGTMNQEIEVFQKEADSFRRFKDQLGDLAKSFVSSLESKPPVHYRTGSLFLKEECFRYLMSSPQEVMHLVTGIEVRNLFILDRLEKIKYTAHITGAKADTKDLLAKLIEIDEKYGYRLMSVFHSHPFNGIDGTRPSGIDRHLQDSLEQAQYKAIQCIFSRDGFFRFFSNKLPFEITIFGRGVEMVSDKDNEKIFKFTGSNG